MQPTTAEPRPLARRMSVLRWVGFIVGCYFLSTMFAGAGFVVGLLIRWPTTWDTLLWALLLLWPVSVVLSGLVMGLVLRVRGRRQWLVAGAWMSSVIVIPMAIPQLARLLQSA